MQWRALAMIVLMAGVAFSGVAAQGPSPTPSPSPEPDPEETPQGDRETPPRETSPARERPREPTAPREGPRDSPQREDPQAMRAKCMERATNDQQRKACERAYCANTKECPACAAPCPCPADKPCPAGCAKERTGPGCPCPPEGAGETCRGGSHVTYTMAADSRGVTDYRVDGRLVALSLRMEARASSDRAGSGDDAGADGEPGGDEPRVERLLRAVRIEADGLRLQLHDNPTGLATFKGRDGALLVQFPAGSGFETRGSGLRVGLPDGGAVFVENQGEALGNATYRFERFASLHVPPPAPMQPAAAGVRLHVREAIEKRHVGAEVHVRGDRAREAEVLAYGDVNVTVTGQATPEAPLSILVSSDLPEGRTIVVNLTRDVLASLDPGALRLAYYDIHDDGTRTEVVFRPAASLADILAPMDDDGQPEYYVVEDQEGLQVMVSVPHWSVHEITVASVLEVLTQPSVLAGLVVGAGGSFMLAVAMFRPRRRQDE